LNPAQNKPIIWLIKSRSIGWAGRVSHKGERGIEVSGGET